MNDAVDPEDLLLDLSGKTDDEAAAFGERQYRELYLQRGRTGSLQTHDGELVLFFEDRYHHAFHTSNNRAKHAYSKAKVASDRIERLAWIGPMIEGRFPDFECWEVPLKVPEEGQRNFPGKRLYVSWAHCYLVWLNIRNNGGYIFSTAYCCHQKDIARYIQRSRKLWPVAR